MPRGDFDAEIDDGLGEVEEPAESTRIDGSALQDEPPAPRRPPPRPPPRKNSRIAEPLEPQPASRRPPPRRPPPRANGSSPPPPVEEEAPQPEAGEYAEATRIAPPPARRPAARDDDENATSAGPPVSVEIVEGPDAGLKLPVRGGRMIIGRGEGCDLRLSDASTSRRHAELVVGPGSTVLRDLGSGNGTQLNGKKVTESDVAHGDRVEMGETVLRIVDELKRLEEQRSGKPAPGKRVPPRRPTRRADEPEEAKEEASEATGLIDIRGTGLADTDDDESTGTLEVQALPPKPRGIPQRTQGGRAKLPLAARIAALPRNLRLAIYGGMGVIALLFVLVLVSSIKPTPPPPPPSRDAEYQGHVEEGKKALREGKYDEAIKAFEMAESVVPATDTSKTREIGRFLDTAKRDGKATSQLNQAKRLAARGEWEEALAALKAVDDRSGAFDEARELMPTYEAGMVKALTESVRKAGESGDFETARELLAKAPPAQVPQLERTIAEMEKRWASDEAGRAAAARAAAVRAQNERARRARAEVDAALAGVVKKIDAGNADGALRELEKVSSTTSSEAVREKARRIKKLIPMFANAYNDGMARFNGGSYEMAGGSLMRALNLYREMDLSGTLEEPLKAKAAKALTIKGRGALARQEYGTAAKAFKDAVSLDPSNAEANNGLNQISRKANDVYMQGYVEMGRNPDYARKKFLEVLEMAPSSDPNYKNAKKRLAELEGAPQ